MWFEWFDWPDWGRLWEHVDLVIVGIVLATVGAITSGLGMNLMKASSRFESHKPWYKRVRFLVGVSLACWVNTALDCVAFALTPLAIIAPIGGVTIVASVLISRTGISGEGEIVTIAQWGAIAAVVVGVGVVAVAGPHPEPVLNTTVVLQHFHEPPFLLYQTLAVSMLVLTYTGLFTGRLGGPNIETTLATAATAGVCSGITQTMMKVMATCVGDFAITRRVPFLHPEFWIALTELIVVAFILLHMLNKCLASADLSLSTPLYQVSVILFTIIAGCAFYGDLEMATKAELSLFILGVALVVTGLGVLIYKRDMSRERLLPTKDKESETAKAPAPRTTTEIETSVVEAPLEDLDPDPEL